MRASAAVVVPLKQGLNRAAGQQTYLNAMRLEKPTIVTNSLGVNNYIKNGVTALIVDGSTNSYVDAIHRVFDPSHADEINAMRQAARRAVLRHYTFDNHVERLLEFLDEVIQVGSTIR
jgi:glycosyltransferase involved in cell wall biosynthesis